MNGTMEKSKLVSRMQEIDPYEFEEFVAALWRQQGWDASATQSSQDMGVDVVAERHGAVTQRHLIQAKRYGEGNKVGRPTLQQSYSLKDQDRDADAVVVVTTSEFTAQARVWAMDYNLKLVDGEELANIVVENNAYNLVDRYAPDSEPDADATNTLREAIDTNPNTETTTTTETTTGPPPDEPSVPGVFNHLIVAVLVQILSFALLFDPKLAPSLTGVGTALVMLTWVGVPFLMFKDANSLHKAGTSYTPNRLIWPFVSFMFPVVTPLGYMYQRTTETNFELK